LIGYKGCSQFLVHKSRIQHLPYKFYIDLYNWIINFEEGKVSGWEAGKISGWILEWTWHLFWVISPKYEIYKP